MFDKKSCQFYIERELVMENEMMTQTKKHFSRLGLMYFLGTLIILGGQYLTSFIVGAAAPDLYENYDLYFIIIMLPMYIISMPLMALLIRTVPAVQPSEKKKMSVGQWIVAFLMCYAAMYVSNIVGTILTQIIGILKGSSVTNNILAVASSANPWTNLLIMVICAPIAEELLFRKLLIDRTIKYGEGCAIFFSGLFFGLFHGNLNQFVYAFVMGLFFGFIYIRTRNIIYTILMHMLNNFISSIVAMSLLKSSGYLELMESGYSTTEEMMPFITEHLPQMLIFMVYILVVIGLTITGIILLIVNAKKFTCNPGEITVPKGKRFSTYILNVGMILFCAIWLIQIILQLFQ